MDRRQKTLIAALLATMIAGQHGLAWSQGAGQNSLPWQPTLEDAKRVAAQTNRLVLVHFWSPSCAPCLQLEQNVFSQPQVQQAIQGRFVPVKLNADDWPTTVKFFQVTRLPTDLVITPGGQIVGRMLSPPTADSYLQQLNIAASGTGPAASPTGAAYVAGTIAPAVPPVTAAMSTPAAYGGSNPYSAAPYSAAPYSAAPQTSAPPQYGMSAQPPQPPTNAPTTTQLAATPTSTQPAISAYSDSRYAEFYQRFGTPAATGSTDSQAPVASTVVNNTMPGPTIPNYQSVPNPYSPDGRYAPVTSPSNPQFAPQASMSTQAAPQSNGSAQFPPSAAGMVNQPPSAPIANVSPLGLEGYSPVSVVDQQRWQIGDRRWGAIHRGRTYLFTGPDEQQKFLSNPDRYAPALSGRDPVVAFESGQEVDGKRQFGVEYANRMYLFSSEASQRMFSQNPKRYVAEVLQAESPSRTMMR